MLHGLLSEQKTLQLKVAELFVYLFVSYFADIRLRRYTAIPTTAAMATTIRARYRTKFASSPRLRNICRSAALIRRSRGSGLGGAGVSVPVAGMVSAALA